MRRSFERAVARVRKPAEELGATQFEALTAAALAEFAGAGVDVAVVEAGLGGTARRDERRRRAGRPAHERRPRAHGGARRHGGGDREGEACSCACGKSSCHVGQHARTPHSRQAATSSSEGRKRRPRRSSDGRSSPRSHVELPGRLERRGDEVWDGAHTPEAVDWLLARLPARDHVLCVSILGDKRVDEMLERSAARRQHACRDAVEQPPVDLRGGARGSRRATLRGRAKPSPIHVMHSRAREPSAVRCSSPARSISWRICTRERKTAENDRKLANG